MIKSWRHIATPIIAQVLLEHGREDTKELRKALFDAYPFGYRQYWPYKVWLSEIKNQLHPNEDVFVDPDQVDLFGILN